GQLKGLGIIVLLQTLGNQIYFEHFVVIEKGFDQRVAGFYRKQRGKTDQSGNGGLFDGDILRVQLQQADATGKHNTDHPKSRENINFAGAHKIAQAVNNGKSQCHHNSQAGAQMLIAAQFHQDQRGNNDIEQDISQQTF